MNGGIYQSNHLASMKYTATEQLRNVTMDPNNQSDNKEIKIKVQQLTDTLQ